MKKSMLCVAGLSVMMLQSCIKPCCEYIQRELADDPVCSVESVECESVAVYEESVEAPSESVEGDFESREGTLDVNIDRDFIKETPLTYQVRRANDHDYMIFVSVYGVAAVHDPDCSCGHAN